MTEAPVDKRAVRTDARAAPPRRPRRRLLGVAVVTAALAAGWLSASDEGPAMSTTTFTVHDGELGRDVYTLDVAVGETFELRHRHSVTKRPVVETFSVHSDSTLALEELWFDTHGPNLPAGPDQLGPDTTFLSEDGGYRVLHHDEVMAAVPLRVGSPGVNHVVTFANGELVRLLDVARAGAPVELRVARAAQGGTVSPAPGPAP